jgi:hypothetical protein
MGTALLDPLFPEMDPSSAVFPTVRIDGVVLHLAYYLPGCDDSAVVTFNGVSSWRYGEPNDEGLHKHPLWGHGLTFYGFHEVKGSRDQDEKRWVATFHDGTFEVSATGTPEIPAARVKGRSPAEALNEILGPGENKVLDEVA